MKNNVQMCSNVLLTTVKMVFDDNVLTIHLNKKMITPADLRDKKPESTCIFKCPHLSTNTNIKAILSCCVFFILSAILKQNEAVQSHLFLHCVKTWLVLSQPPRMQDLQCQITCANQGVVIRMDTSQGNPMNKF